MPFETVKADSSNLLASIASSLATSRRIVVITGAGISTNCGIPDFRSRDGLYSQTRSQHVTSSANKRSTSGRDLFDAQVWNNSDSTRDFFQFMAALRQKIHTDVNRTSATHKFIRSLRDQRKLVRCYTQNIDGLETREELSMDLAKVKGAKGRCAGKPLAPSGGNKGTPGSNEPDRGCEVVPLHGDLGSLRCQLCNHKSEWTMEAQRAFTRGEAPACTPCLDQSATRDALGKRGVAVGTLRPNVVLYGEHHPETEAIGGLTEHDLKMRPDLLLIMGTSLKVHGLKTLVKEFARSVHALKRGKRAGKVVFVNLGEPAKSVWGDVVDYWVDMDCDAWVADMKRRRPDVWETQAAIGSRVTKTPTPATNAGRKRKAEEIGDPEEDKENGRAPTRMEPPLKKWKSSTPPETSIRGCRVTMSLGTSTTLTRSTTPLGTPPRLLRSTTPLGTPPNIPRSKTPLGTPTKSLRSTTPLGSPTPRTTTTNHFGTPANAQRSTTPLGSPPRNSTAPCEPPPDMKNTWGMVRDAGSARTPWKTAGLPTPPSNSHRPRQNSESSPQQTGVLQLKAEPASPPATLSKRRRRSEDVLIHQDEGQDEAEEVCVWDVPETRVEVRVPSSLRKRTVAPVGKRRRMGFEDAMLR